MKYIVTILLLMLVGKSIPVQAGTGDYVLLISSYSSRYPGPKVIENAFRVGVMKEAPTMKIYCEYMSCDRFPSPDTWLETMHLIIKNYASHPPKLVVLLSDEAWMAYRKAYSGQWGDVKVLLAGVKHWGVDFDRYREKQQLHFNDFKTITELCKGYNATGLTERVGVSKTVDLMKRLFPDMEEVVVIGDNCFSGIYATLLAQKFIPKEHPELKYIPLDGRFITTDSLYKRLESLPERAGILFSSWLQDVDGSATVYEEINPKIRMLGEDRPIFTLSDWGGQRGWSMGGCYNPSVNYGRTLAGIAVKLLGGAKPEDIPLCDASEDFKIHLNKISVKKYGLSPEVLEEPITYFNSPPTFLQKYKAEIIEGLICLLVLVLVFMIGFYFYRTRKYLVSLKNLSDNLKHSLTNQKYVSESLEIFLQANTETTAVNNMLLRVLNEYHADRAYIFEFDRSGQYCDNTYEMISENVTSQKDSLQRIPLSTIPNVYATIKRNEILVEDDLAGARGRMPEGEWKILADQGIVSILLAPLCSGNRTWGFAGVDFVREKRSWTEQDQLYLITLSHVLSMGITHFRSETLKMRSELRFGYLYKNMSLSICMFDAKGVVQEMNEHFLEVTGLQDKKDILGLSLYSLRFITEEQWKTLDEKGQLVLDYVFSPEIWRDEYHIYSSRQETCYFTIHIKVLRDDQNNVMGYMMVWIDNTVLIEARSRAEESDRLKSAFIANMSHEIRTPLNAIVGFSELLTVKEETDEEAREEYIQLIRTNTDLLLQLISDILDLSKIEAGVLEFVPEKVDLELFMSGMESVYSLKQKKGLEIKFIRKHAELQFLFVDKNRLSQVVSNFLNNALKFTSEGHIHFGYDVREKEVYFFVEDTGTGIPMEKQAAIFERFVKLDSFKQGTGLGLSICSTIVEKWEGQIGVDSEEGKGATFWFTVPKG